MKKKLLALILALLMVPAVTISMVSLFVGVWSM